MSPHFSRPRLIGSSAAICTSLAAFLVGACARNPTPAVASPTSATATATPSATASAATGAKGNSVDAKAGAATNDAAKKAADAEKEKARQAAAERVPVETAEVTRGSISAFLTFNSTVETEAAVDIFPQTGGQVEALFVEEGVRVQSGDPLLQIDERELRVEVNDATTSFEHLQRNFARFEDLYTRQLINKQEYEEQRFQLDKSGHRLELAKIRLSHATVRAPFSGVISSRDTQLGARVGVGTKVFSIVKLDEIVARVFVPGRYLAAVAENQPAVVTSDFLPSRPFTGWVKRISPIIDPKNGTFRVTVGVRGETPGELPPGLFVNVRVVTATRDAAVLIPKRAIVYEGGERYVFAVNDGKASKRKLVPGYEEPMTIEALSGIDVGERVIVLGQNGLKDGVKIQDVSAPAEPVTADGPKPAEAAAASMKTTSPAAPITADKS